MQALAHPQQKWLWKRATQLVILLALLLLSVTSVSAFSARTAIGPPGAAAPVLLSPAAPATDWCSNISTPTTWTLAGSPYVVCPIYVNSGVTLTIDAGVVVKFTQGNGSITVDGALVARGTPQQPIIFTSFRDDSAAGDTNGDANATSPAPGDWNWLHFNGASRGVLEHAVVRYGGDTYGHNVQIDTPNVTLTDSTFAYAREEGIYFEGAVPPLLARNQFIGNGTSAVWLGMYNASSLTLEDNQATGNGINGFVVNTAVNGPVTWDGDVAFPFVAYGLGVNASGQFTLTPGTVVKSYNADTTIRVYGRMHAQGTADQPIIFTSLRDDTAGGNTDNNARTAPAPGDWNTLTFEGASSGSVLDHVEVRYAGHSWGYGLLVGTPDILITNSAFAYNQDKGIYFEGAIPSQLTNNRFIGNTGPAARLGMYSATSFTLAGNQVSGNGVNGFVVSTAVNSNVTWDGDPALPFVVESLGVARGAIFTLSPGDIFKSSGPHIGVAGTLIARGAAAQPIYFTSLRDDTVGGDTNGDGGATAPAPGDWNNLRFEYAAPVSGNVLEHVVVRYGGQGWHENIYVDNTDLTMRHAASTDANGAGLSMNAASIYVQDSTFMTNHVGVWVGGNSNVVVTESRLANNRDYGVQNYSAPKLVNARYNWWGAASGPHHPTQNASGTGNAVSDGVLFTPWHEQPDGSPVQRVVFQILGPRAVTPGDTFDYVIDYYTSYAIDDAMLLFSIPFGSNFVAASNGGAYFGPSSQIYWTLGDLPAGSEGSVRVTAQALWGLPASFPDGAATMMGGTNLQIAPYVIDITDFAEYEPVHATGSNQLNDAQIAAALAASAPLQTLYDEFIAQGFVRFGGVALTTSDGHQTTAILLVHPQSQATVDLRCDQTGDKVMAITYAGDVVTVTDPNGAMQFDLLQNTATGTDFWAETALRGGFTPARTQPTVEEIRPFTCFRNCALKETGMWAIKKLSSTVKAVLAMRACLQAIGGDPAAYDTCASLFTSKIAETVPVVSEAKALTKCISECVNPDTRQKHACTGPLTTVELPTWAWASPQSWTEEGRRRQYIMYDCNTSTGMWSTSHLLYCLRGFVAQKGASDEEGRPCVPANDNVAAWYYNNEDRKVPSASSPVTLNVAKDPNAKYGIYGVDQATALPGQTLVYTVTCENEGSGTAYSVYILDTLSSYLDETTLDLGGKGQYSAALRQISWDVGDLAPKGAAGSTAVVTFTIKPRAALTDGLEIPNQAVVYFPSVPEVTPTNVVVNTIRAVAAIPQAIAAVAGHAQVIVLHGAGPGALTYTIVEAPHYGVLSGSPPNLSYTPDTGYSGADYFTFRVASGGQTSEPAEVSITVTPDPTDSTPPAVLSVSPVDAARLPLPDPATFTDTLGLAYYPLATFQFSKPLDAASVTASSVRLSADGQPVNATVQYVAGLNQVILTPREAMHQATLYTLRVTTDVRDSNGHALAAPFTTTFQLQEQASADHHLYLPMVRR